MRKVLLFILFLFSLFAFAGCNRFANKRKCLNYDTFKEFYYNNHLYRIPNNYDEIYSAYEFYGPKHKVGYTIGVYNHVFETYVLDNDIEENILFQEYGYFWFKEGFNITDLSKIPISKLLIEKLDSNGFSKINKEFQVENAYIADLFIEYSVDSIKEPYLLDHNNYLKYCIKVVFGDAIISRSYYFIALYNENVFIETYSLFHIKTIYVINKQYSTSLYEFIKDSF